MRIRLLAVDGERSYDTQLGRFTQDEAIPCFRCGVCCRRWQPLLTRPEAERLAEHLGLGLEEFLSGYTRPYPLEEEAYLLNQRDGGCIFLRVEGDGRTLCGVHEARPQACRDWDASLLRKECLDGLAELSGIGGLVLPLTLYDDPEDAERLRRQLRRKVTWSLGIRALPPD
jgi:Fe-S-cluster containining protein